MNDDVVQRNLYVDELILDWQNPRLKSRYKDEYKKYGFKEQEKILICNLVAYFNLDDLIKDILLNSKISFHVFSSDLVIVQFSKSANGLYDVKEGNRRIACLKILKNAFCDNGNLLTDICAFMIQEGLFDTELEKQFNSHRTKINNILKKNKDESDGKVLSIPCNIYENNREADRTLKNVLRRMHIKTKRTWESIDKKLFDYDDIIEKINLGAKSVDEAINNLLEEEANLSGVVVTKNLFNTERDEFKTTSFYHYIIQLIDKGALGDNKYILKDKLLYSFLPICDVMRKSMLNSCGISFNYLIENNELKFEISQLENYPIIKNKEDFIIDIILKIMNLEEVKPISNIEFKNKKEDNKNPIKSETRFYQFFKEIIVKYAEINEIVEDSNSTAVHTIPMGIYLKENLKNNTLKVKIPNDPIQLRDKIEKIIDSSGNSVDIKKCEILIDGTLLDEGMELIDSQTQSGTKVVQYKFRDCNQNNLISCFYINFVSEDTPPPGNNILFDLLTPFDKIELPCLKENLIKEINSLEIHEYKNLLSLTLRCLFELPIRELMKLPDYNNVFTKNMTENVEILERKIRTEFDTNAKCNDMENYYGIDKKTIRTQLTSSTLNYKDVYEKTNAAMHGSLSFYSENDVRDYGKYARNWVYVLNYLYYKSKGNI